MRERERKKKFLESLWRDILELVFLFFCLFSCREPFAFAAATTKYSHASMYDNFGLKFALNMTTNFFYFVNKRVKAFNFSKENPQMALVVCHCLLTANCVSEQERLNKNLACV